MLRTFFGKTLLVGLATLLFSCTAQTTTSSPETNDPADNPELTGTIVVGDVTSQPAKKIKRYQPLADYLAANLGEFGIGVGEVKVAPDTEAMASLLKSGEVDIYFDSPYPAMLVNEISGAKPVLRRWKGGDAVYYTVIFAMTDSGFTGLDDLTGYKVAFDDPTSTSGYVLPMVHMMEAGLNMKKKESSDESVAADEVGYVFSQDDQNNIQWVISRRVDAAAIDHRSFLNIPPESREAMTVLAETEKVARHVVLVREGLDPKLVEQIKQTLLNMDQSPEGREVMENFEETTKFDNFPTEEDIARMRELYEKVKNR
ncbi:MAG: phosphate/phosphite/phosphonate ABC transporter substrate-binding protein [Limnoraphis sp. WC205]|jgi:phosphonate transport system substrate-binding protein|nr:phosphate/phosphite/phosphonate ABC transporter substrate-binding protein [Limnoraphis sp. WC205]